MEIDFFCILALKMTSDGIKFTNFCESVDHRVSRVRLNFGGCAPRPQCTTATGPTSLGNKVDVIFAHSGTNVDVVAVSYVTASSCALSLIHI